MGRHERVEDEVDRPGGKATEVIGDATGHRGLEREGRREQAGTELRQAAGKAKDVVKDAFTR